jgi:putative MFS transporter
MFLGARKMHYVLHGMGMDAYMVMGMVLVGAGLVAILVGVLPRRRDRVRSVPVEVAVDEATPIGGAHLKLIVALVFAIAIDSQKPFTFTFILPGVAKEYGLSTPVHDIAGHWPVSLLPLAGIAGTVIGSFLWGLWADRVGRRAPIFAAAGLFIATAMCGAMPSFTLNIVMCALMGLAAGGMLPIAFSLLSEIIPGSRRGQAIMLVAGLGTGLGFLLASWLAHWLMPTFGWRIMWLVGAPTGLVLMLLNRFIPESPRFLIAAGRGAEAEGILQRFGMTVRSQPATVARISAPARSPVAVSPTVVRITAALAVFGLAWGLVNYGFLTWLPTRVHPGDLGAASVTTLLAKAALFSIPGALVVAWLYGRWSSKGTLIVAGLAVAAALAAFALGGRPLIRDHALFTFVIVVLLTFMWAAASALLLYCAEIYPTRVRAGAGGFVAGTTKLGGVLAFAMASAAIAPPSIPGAAWLAAVPILVAAAALLIVGRETRGLPLEQIAAELAQS